MKAVVITEFGGPEVLKIVEISEPHAGPGEVRIRVAAAAVNPTDTLFRSGAYSLPIESPAPHVPGMDAAGIIDEVGEGVDWSIGEKVMAIVLHRGRNGGAYASHIVVPGNSIAKLPANASMVEAATLPMNALTARLSLDQLALKPGQTLAVTGAAGAYGGYVIELAKQDGLYVIADASEVDEALVYRLGADIVVRRGDDVAQKIRKIKPNGVDGLADGAVLNEKILPAIKNGGALAVIRGCDFAAERDISIHQTFVYEYACNRDALDRLRQQVEAGKITLRVATIYESADASEAHKQLEAGGTRGRIVLTF
jgi:hypothetical protein